MKHAGIVVVAANAVEAFTDGTAVNAVVVVALPRPVWPSRPSPN